MGYEEVKKRTLVSVVVILFALTQYAGLVPLRAGYNQQVGQQKYPTDSKHVLSSPNWLSGWSFRKAHVITGSAGAGTNYQIEIVAHYGSGSDSGPDVYCNHNCQPSFEDIRFTADDGVSLLHFWREEALASDHAVFWVKITDDLSSDVSIYVYYGNPTAMSTNGGDSTFIFFDDFESGVFDPAKWENPGDWQIVTTDVRDGSYAAILPRERFSPDAVVQSRFKEPQLRIHASCVVQIYRLTQGQQQSTPGCLEAPLGNRSAQ